MIRLAYPREPWGLHQLPQGKWRQKEGGDEESIRPWHLSQDFRREPGRENERHSMEPGLTAETVRKLEALRRESDRPVTGSEINIEGS